MAWYHDKNRTTYVATYKDEKAARKELEEASKHGWMAKDTAGMSGHLNVGRTAARVALTGGVGLLFGASRSKDKLTITFLRDQDFVARTKFEETLKELNSRRPRLEKARTEFHQATAKLTPAVSAALETADLDREQIEKELKRALNDVVDRRDSLIRNQRLVLDALVVARNAGKAAGTVVTVPGANSAEEYATGIQSEQTESTQALPREKELLKLQEEIVKAANQWRDSSEQVRKAAARVAESERRIAEASAALQTAPAEIRDKTERKTREEEAELGKRRSEHESKFQELHQREQRLRALMSQRGQAAAVASEVDSAPAIAAASAEQPADDRPAPPAERPSDSDSTDVLANLEKLAELHRAGVLTDEEFAIKKSDLLSRI